MKLFLKAANKPKIPEQILAAADLTKEGPALPLGPHWHASIKSVAFTVSHTIPKLSLSGEYDLSIVLTAADLLALLRVAVGPQDLPARMQPLQGPHICAAGTERPPVATAAKEKSN
jgi:hypothetical protein